VVKPFLLLAIRAEDAAADNEYATFLDLAGLAERDLRRVRLEQRALGNVDLRDWSGILLGGGPFNYSDADEGKSPLQRRVEADLHALLDAVVSADFPFLGACYGIGALGRHQGAVVDRRYAEPVGCVPVALTRRGREDPLLRGLPATFDAFTGHKEAVSRLPGHAVRLASSPACPVQAFRIGSNVYATQFHPELDVAGMCTRIEVYKHAGYFAAEHASELKALARRSNVTHPAAIVRRFVQRFARRGAADPVPDGASEGSPAHGGGLAGGDPQVQMADVLGVGEHFDARSSRRQAVTEPPGRGTGDAALVRAREGWPGKPAPERLRGGCQGSGTELA
jgi:GMP synthase (glutamine-hydrolysing)